MAAWAMAVGAVARTAAGAAMAAAAVATGTTETAPLEGTKPGEEGPQLLTRLLQGLALAGCRGRGIGMRADVRGGVGRTGVGTGVLAAATVPGWARV